jgi:hypothetical protein
MKKVLKITSFLATGAILGALAGKVALDLNKGKRHIVGKTKSVRDYLIKDGNEGDASFI